MRTFYIVVELCHRYDLSPSYIVTELTCQVSPIWYVTDLTVTDMVYHRFDLYPQGKGCVMYEIFFVNLWVIISYIKN